jgi:hypothetical protein
MHACGRHCWGSSLILYTVAAAGFGWLNSPFFEDSVTKRVAMHVDGGAAVASFWQQSPIKIGDSLGDIGRSPAAPVDSHFSPVTPLPPSMVHGGATARSTDVSIHDTGEEDPVARRIPNDANGTTDDADSSSTSSTNGSGSEADAELCIIGRAMSAVMTKEQREDRAKSVSPPWSDTASLNGSPLGGKADLDVSTVGFSYREMSESGQEELYTKLLQQQGVDGDIVAASTKNGATGVAEMSGWPSEQKWASSPIGGCHLAASSPTTFGMQQMLEPHAADSTFVWSAGPSQSPCQVKTEKCRRNVPGSRSMEMGMRTLVSPLTSARGDCRV